MSKTGFKSKDVSINLKENIQKDLFMAWTVQELKSVEVGFGVSSKNIANHQIIFFHQCFIHNYCPLVFMTSSGKNITPPQLPKGERQQLLELCDKSLMDVVKLTGVKIVVGIGKFAEERARKALINSEVEVFSIMHPSPASPAANAGWTDIALTQLTDLGLMGYIKNENKR